QYAVHATTSRTQSSTADTCCPRHPLTPTITVFSRPITNPVSPLPLRSISLTSPLPRPFLSLFSFNNTATTEIYTLSLHDALPILKLEPHPGSSLRDPTGILIMIPVDVTIELESPAPPASGLVDVLWNDQAYSVFFEDLQEK